MTPKEKAKELVDRFYEDRLRASASGKIRNAKYLALICINEILKIRTDDLTNPDISDLDLEFTYLNINYWNEVKQEIENL